VVVATLADKMWEIAKREGVESRAELARILDIKSQSMYQWFKSDESLRTSPRSLYVSRFCAHFAITEDELRSGAVSVSKSKPRIIMTRDEKVLLQAFRQLNDEEKDKIIDAVLDMSLKL
jgi:hypothetical protein